MPNKPNDSKFIPSAKKEELASVIMKVVKIEYKSALQVRKSWNASPTEKFHGNKPSPIDLAIGFTNHRQTRPNEMKDEADTLALCCCSAACSGKDTQLV